MTLLIFRITIITAFASGFTPFITQKAYLPINSRGACPELALTLPRPRGEVA
jgi:hypothetical protein